MSGRVGRVDKLAGNKAVGNLLGKLLRLGNGPGHALGSFGEHQLGPVGLHQLAALHAHGLRHDDDDPIAPGGGYGGQPNAGVARGGLDHHRTGLQQALGLGVVDHGLGNPVFYAARGVEILQLCQNAGLKALGLLNAGQLQQGGAADQLAGGRVDGAHNNVLLKYLNRRLCRPS